MKLLGLFRSESPKDALNHSDCPCVIWGGNALCAEDVTTMDGITACVVGRVRDRAEVARAAAGEKEFTDTRQSALIIAAYRRWGTEYARHVAGAFVSAVYDERRATLIVTRDRMGEIPLFYARAGARVAFSIHPRALIDVGAVSPAMGRAQLCEAFGLGPARSPGETFLEGVRSLKPGHILLADPRGVREKRYFSLTARPHEDSEAETVDKTRFLLTRAVEEILPANPGVMLSGGLDSTVLTALIARLSAQPPLSFSVEYEGNERYFRGTDFQPASDSAFVDLAAAHIGAQHTVVTLAQAELVDALADAARARGFPGMADVDSSLLLFARAIAENCRCVVSGECADEVFGGYPWFRDGAAPVTRFPWSDSLELRERILKKSVREKLQLSLYASDRLREAMDDFSPLPGEREEDAHLRATQALCFQYFMPNLQERAFFLCENASLAVLTPYCDDRLVSYLYNVPWDMKRMGGHTKGLLRQAARDLLPDELLYRRKSPYPKTHHPAYLRLVRERFIRMLADEKSPLRALLDIEEVMAIAESPLSPSAYPWYGQLMTGAQMLAYLMQMDGWMRENKVEIDL